MRTIDAGEDLFYTKYGLMALLTDMNYEVLCVYKQSFVCWFLLAS